MSVGQLTSGASSERGAFPDAPRRPLRVLFLASYFPRPGVPLAGVWAMSQAQALLRQGLDLSVVSLTSWVPSFFRTTERARNWASCPPEHLWGGLRVEYPRWLLYQVDPFKRLDYARPWVQHQIAWLSARRTLTRLVEERQPDVIYAHHTQTNGDLARRLHRLFKVPYVVTDHDFWEVADCEKHPKRRRFFRRVIDDAFAMVAVSSRMERLTRRLFPAARTRIVHNGADEIPEISRNVPRPREIQRNAVVLSVGAFAATKQFPLLVRAFARVAEKHPRAVLRIIGDGADRPAVEATVRELGLGERVQLLGFQPHERVQQEMVWCDVFALLSSTESFGVVYAEAMAAGRPVICTTNCGIIDVVEDSVHGHVVPPTDLDAAAAALDRLLSDENARSRMGRAARELYLSRLTWDRNAGDMVKILHEAAASAGAAAASPPLPAPAAATARP